MASMLLSCLSQELLAFSDNSNRTMAQGYMVQEGPPPSWLGQTKIPIQAWLAEERKR
jgi:hypothetical protein